MARTTKARTRTRGGTASRTTAARRTTSTPRRAPRAAGTRRMDVIALLKQDHREVDSMFRRYRTLGARAMKSKQDLVHKIIRELSVHASVEEQILYPRMREVMREQMISHALDEHQEVKELLAGLQKMKPEDERFDGCVKELMKNVKEHVREEEGEMLPMLRKALDRDELVRMAEMMKIAKKTAPTRPHPMAPSTPPGNIVVGMASAVVDRARDAGRAIGRRTRSSS